VPGPKACKIQIQEEWRWAAVMARLAAQSRGLEARPAVLRLHCCRSGVNDKKLVCSGGDEMEVGRGCEGSKNCSPERAAPGATATGEGEDDPRRDATPTQIRSR